MVSIEKLCASEIFRAKIIFNKKHKKFINVKNNGLHEVTDYKYNNYFKKDCFILDNKELKMYRILYG
jgi:hypothetical protein